MFRNLIHQSLIFLLHIFSLVQICKDHGCFYNILPMLGKVGNRRSQATLTNNQIQRFNIEIKKIYVEMANSPRIINKSYPIKIKILITINDNLIKTKN